MTPQPYSFCLSSATAFACLPHSPRGRAVPEVLFELLNLLLNHREAIVALPHLRRESLFNVRRRTFIYDPTTMHPNPSIMASTPPSQEDPEVLFELLKLLLKLREAIVALPHLRRKKHCTYDVGP